MSFRLALCLVVYNVKAICVTWQIASRPDRFARAVPTIASYLEKPHAGLKFSAASLLEACHQYAPQSLLAQTVHMIDSLKDGSLVLSPALAHLYEMQPEAQDLFSQHVEWMLDIYEVGPLTHQGVSQPV